MKKRPGLAQFFQKENGKRTIVNFLFRRLLMDAEACLLVFIKKLRQRK